MYQTMHSKKNMFISLENTLNRFCKPVSDKFQHGLSENNIKDILFRSNVESVDIVELYKWKNGVDMSMQKHIGEFNFFSIGNMLPLEQAIKHYEIYVMDRHWKSNYFPLFTTNAGDFLLFDFDSRSVTYGMLLIYSPGLLVVEPETAYNSIESFIYTIITCYEQGVYNYNENENTLDIDIDKEFEVSSELNSKAEYWKS